MSRKKVVARIGPPERRDRGVRPAGVMATWFRYRSITETTLKADPTVELRLCYDRKDRLSVKLTAPAGMSGR